MVADTFARSKLTRGSYTARSSASTSVDVTRRALDLSISLVAVVVLSPVIAVVAALVKLDSSGPVLFRQQRIGRNRRSRAYPDRKQEGEARRERELYGEPFTLYKFRTMHADARERHPELYRYRYSEEERHTLPIKVLVADKDAATRSGNGADGMGQDPRVTQIGHWLRRTSLDELPNLFNVVKGDMHLVGPRPDIADNIRYYDAQELAILDVKPGITGLAQIRGRGLLTFAETNACDLEYVRRRSLVLDLKILLGTIPALLNGRGAY